MQNSLSDFYIGIWVSYTSRIIFLYLLLTLLIITPGIAQNVISVFPKHFQKNVQSSTNIQVVFDSYMNENSINATTFIVSSLLKGPCTGAYTYDTQTNTSTFIPVESFFVGDQISVVLTSGITNILGDPLPQKRQWQFSIDVTNGSGVFGPTKSSSAGFQGVSYTQGDFNADGYLDVAVVGRGDLRVLMNEGLSGTPGKFIEQVFEPNTTYNQSIEATDIDNDNDLDIVFINESYDLIFVYLNDPVLGFTATNYFTIDVPDRPRDIVMEDFDGDGDIDLVATFYDSGWARLMTNPGNGHFVLTPRYILVSKYQDALAAGDLDGDGDIDLAISSGEIYLNDGNGSYSKKSDLSTVTYDDVLIADINGDSHQDVLLLNGGNANVLIFSNNGDATFSNTIPLFGDGNVAYGIQVCDLDKDDDLDVIFVNTDYFRIYRNNDGSTFELIQTIYPDNSPYLYDVGYGDFDNDNDIDIYVGIGDENPSQFYENMDRIHFDLNTQGNTHFNTLKLGHVSTIHWEISNESGYTDTLIISSILSSNPDVFSASLETAAIPHNQTKGIDIRFSPQAVQSYSETITFTSNDPLHQQINVDIDGAGGAQITDVHPGNGSMYSIDDMIISAGFNSDINSSTFNENSVILQSRNHGLIPATYHYDPGIQKVYITPETTPPAGENIRVTLTDEILSNEDNIELIDGFSWGFIIAPEYGTARFKETEIIETGGNSSTKLATGDFNRDGVVDYITVNSASDNFSVFLNDGLNSFYLLGTYPVGDNPQGVDVADFNGDGWLDVFIVNSLSNSLTIYENILGTTFNRKVNAITGNYPKDVIAVDLDNNNYLEIIVSNSLGNSIKIFENYGSSFSSSSSKGTLPGPGTLLAEDFDNDGVREIVVLHVDDNSLTAYGISTCAVGSAPIDIYSGDFNQDGYLDMAVANNESDDVTILLNNSGNSFTASTFAAGSQPVTISGQDFNGDGVLDLAVGNFASHDIYIFSGDGAGGFTPVDTIDLNFGLRDIHPIPRLQDIGIIDLLAVNMMDDQVVYLKNDEDNAPPQKISQLSDFLFKEDMVPDTLIRNLNTVYVDTIDFDALEFLIICDNPNINTILTEEAALLVSVPENYFGQGDITISASDVFATIYDTLHIQIDSVNDIPKIISPTDVTATEDQRFTYTAEGIDVESEVLIYSFLNLPHWMIASSDSIFGVPTEGDLDTLFRVVASDGIATDTLAVNVSVTPVNDPPVITSSSSAQATEDIYFSYRIAAFDEEGAELIYTFQDLPPWLSSEADSMFGTPREGDQSCFVHIVASDGESTDTLDLSIVITPVNDPVTILAVDDIYFNEDDSTTALLVVNDPDNDEISITGKADSTAIEFSFQGDTLVHIRALGNWFGSSYMQIRVTDGFTSDSVEFLITVAPINDAPKISNIPDTTLYAGMEVIINLDDYVTDIDSPDDSIQWSIEHGENIEFTLERTNLTIKQKDNWTGIDSILFIAMDDSLAADSEIIYVDIRSLPAPENLAATGNEIKQISLAWSSPSEALSKEPIIEELIYDSGEPQFSYTWANGGHLAMRMTAPMPSELVTLRFHHYIPGQFRAGIFDWMGTTPSTSGVLITETSSYSGWYDVDVSSLRIQVDGDFIVSHGYVNNTTALSYDKINTGRGWDWNGAAWISSSETYFIRAVIKEVTTGTLTELGGEIIATNDFSESLAEPKSVSIQSGDPDAGLTIPEDEPLNAFTSNNPLILSSYRIYRANSESGPFALIADNIVDTFYVDTDIPPSTKYYYAVSAVYTLPVGESEYSNIAFATSSNLTSVYGEQIPEEYVLEQNYPNPFNPTTTIRYGLPEDSDVTLNIYDITGREVNALVNKAQAAGWYTVQWNGTKHDGTPVGTGMYFTRIQAGDFSQVIKMVYLR